MILILKRLLNVRNVLKTTRCMHVLTSKKLSATKRLELVKEKLLCFSCLKPARHSEAMQDREDM